MKYTLYCHTLTINSQEYGTKDEHMGALVDFSLEVDGRRYDGLKCVIWQVEGSNIEFDRLHVALPENYDGPLNQDAFKEKMEQYYRSQVGLPRLSLPIEMKPRLRISGVTVFKHPATYSFE